MLPVVSDFDLPAASISSYHDIVAARSAVGRSPSPRTRCLTSRPVAQCWQFEEEAKDAPASECTWTLSALEALRKTLHKFKTYLLTALPWKFVRPSCFETDDTDLNHHPVSSVDEASAVTSATRLSSAVEEHSSQRPERAAVSAPSERSSRHLLAGTTGPPADPAPVNTMSAYYPASTQQLYV